MEFDLGPSMPSVKSDRFGGGVLAAEHLLSLGHRQIALVTATRRVDGLATSGGFLAALERAGIEVPPALRADGNFSYESGAAAAKKLLRSRKPFTAILCANDAMAQGAGDVLTERGIKVPRQVSLTGFEDVRSAVLHSPPLTTVLVDKEAVGRRAVAHLIALIEGTRMESDREVLPVKLVVRESTAAPPGAASRRRGGRSRGRSGKKRLGG
jgi:DNA-binding LacI/PurR family transcriptional regulator